jgi:hypothetical protein
MTTFNPFHPAVLIAALILSLDLSVAVWAQDKPAVEPSVPIAIDPPVETEPPTTPEQPPDSATPANLPSNVSGEEEEDKPAFPPSKDPDKEEPLSGDEAPYKEDDDSDSKPKSSKVPNVYQGFPPHLMSVDMEIAEVKKLAQFELDRLRIRGQYTTTLVSSQLSIARQNEIALLREAVASAKNLVLGKRLSLSAFLNIQRQSIHAELALARTSSMRVSILRKAIEACTLIETKVRGMENVSEKEKAPLFNLSDVDLVVIQREHWEQLIDDGGSTSLISTNHPVQPVMVGTYSAPTVYCPKVRRRR